MKMIMKKIMTIGEMNTMNEVAIQQNSLIPSQHELSVFQVMADQAVNSKMYRGIGDQFAVMTIMLAARELGIPPMGALNGGIHIINGKTEISARMMAALIFKKGHTIEVVESTPEKCVLKGMRSNGQTQLESFFIEEAKQAGLIKDGGGWKKWPKDMLYARCMSRLARRLFPDVIGMGYVEGEISESTVRPVADYTVSVEPQTTIETSASISPVEDDGLLKNFLSQFDKDEAMGWATYIGQLREKLKLSVQAIVDKFNEDPAKATQKFQTWLAQQP